MNRSLTALAAVLALAACEGNSPRTGDEFVANRVVARVQKAETGEELKLDAPLMALQVTSALDASRALTLVVGSDLLGIDTLTAELPPMMQMLIPGPLAARTYPVGSLDLTSEMLPLLDGTSHALASVVAPEPDGDDVDFFSSTGGSVEVVRADAGTGRLPGHMRARVRLDLREFHFDRFPAVYGKQATATGALDGLLFASLASDADVTFSGAFTGRTPRELLGSVFGGLMGGEREWGFLVTSSVSHELAVGELSIRLARVPGVGETLRFSSVAPGALYGPAADTVSVAVLQVFSGTLDGDDPSTQSMYISSTGQLRVDAATPDAIRGTLTLTLAEYDFATGKTTGRTVSATGPVGLSLQEAPGMFNRTPAARAARARFQRR
jgi:hypothetical protein